MPFTLSHSAAVLPILRSKYFSATGLIIGTMAPDFEYFFRMNIQGIYGHTLPGIFYFDLPVSLALALLFHGVVKKNLIDNMPEFFQSRFQQVRHFDFVAYLREHKMIFVWSVIVGTLTHIVWDGFTHQRQYFVDALPWIYKGRVVPFMGIKYPLWYALQYISTTVGLILVFGYVVMMKPAPGVFHRPRIVYWLILLLIVTGIVYIRMQAPIISQWYVVFVITTVSAFCIAITILGLIPFRKTASIGG